MAGIFHTDSMGSTKRDKTPFSTEKRIPLSLKILYALWLFSLCILPFPPASATAPTPMDSWLAVTPKNPTRGSIALVTFRGPKTFKPEKIVWGTRSFPFFRNGRGAYQSLLAIPLSTKKTRFPIHLVMAAQEGEKKSSLTLSLAKKRFPTRTIHLKKRVKLSSKLLEKIKNERKELHHIFGIVTPEIMWRGRFIKPVPGGVTSPFGVRRKINGAYLSIHHGVDFRAHMKTPVHAINRGTVVFRKELVLSGLTIVIDHGMGLYSLYGHLSSFKVKRGDIVKKGQVIGLSGNTGRSTGPHLHLGVVLCGITADPLSIIHLPL